MDHDMSSEKFLEEVIEDNQVQKGLKRKILPIHTLENNKQTTN